MGNRYRLIILHAGLHKTGTTSIQNNCYRHRDLLLEHGIVYPSFKFQHKNIVNHSDCMTADVCENPGGYGAAFRQGVKADPLVLRQSIRPQMDELLQEPKADTLILSGEGIAEYNKVDLQALLDRLQEHTEQLRVVAYIRSPQSSLESILQQRVKSGLAVTPENLTPVVRQRYQRLRHTFDEYLEIINFHDAVEHPSGLVGHFMALAGVPEDKLVELEFKRKNERVTMEAYKLMSALNETYPLTDTPDQSFERKLHDLHPLISLPGQPFHLENFFESDLYDVVKSQGDLLELKLGFAFPEIEANSTLPPWQEETLLALETTVRSLKNPTLQAAVADILCNEAQDLEANRPKTAGILQHIARRLQTVENDKIHRAVENIGADYFKFSALQVQDHDQKLARNLMILALEIRPDSDFLKSRIKEYDAQKINVPK